MNQNSQHIHSSFDDELRLLTEQVLGMGKQSMNQFRATIRLFVKPGRASADEIASKDAVIDSMERDIDRLATRMIALRQPMANDLRRIIASVKIASDIERFADYAKNIARRAPKINDTVSASHIATLHRMARPVAEMFQDVMKAYAKKDMAMTLAVHRRDEEVNKIYDSLFREMLTYMMEDNRQIAASVQVMFIAKHLERMGDHVTNIAEEIYYQETGTLLKEDYKYERRKGKDSDIFTQGDSDD